MSRSLGSLRVSFWVEEPSFYLPITAGLYSGSIHAELRSKMNSSIKNNGFKIIGEGLYIPDGFRVCASSPLQNRYLNFNKGLRGIYTSKEKWLSWSPPYWKKAQLTFPTSASFWQARCAVSCARNHSFVRARRGPIETPDLPTKAQPSVNNLKKCCKLITIRHQGIEAIKKRKFMYNQILHLSTEKNNQWKFDSKKP